MRDRARASLKSSTWATFAVLTLAAWGCGSRTELHGVGGTTENQGGAGAGAGPSTGGQGEGGAPPIIQCANGLEIDPLVDLHEDEDDDVALGSLSTSPLGDIVMGTIRPDGVYQEGLAAIGEWPPGRTGAARVEAGPYKSIATAPVLKNRFVAVYGSARDFSTVGETRLEGPLTPGASTNAIQALLEAEPSGALFSAGSNEAQFLVGAQRHRLNRESVLYRGRAGTNSLIISTGQTLGCASSPLSMDAVPGASGFILATTSAGPLEGACLVDGPAGPAKTITVLEVNADTMIERATVEARENVLQLHVARTTKGETYVAYTEAIPGSPLSVFMISPDFSSVVGPVEIEGLGSDEFAFSPLADGVVLSWITTFPSIQARFIHNGLTVESALTQPISLTGITAGRALGAGTPNTERALVAWTHRAKNKNSVMATRIRCSKSPI